jgi:hypothetical protein
LRVLSEHDQMVHDFFLKAAQENPERFQEVCKRNPVLSGRQWRRIHEKETRLTPTLAGELGIETSPNDDDSYE